MLPVGSAMCTAVMAPKLELNSGAGLQRKLAPALSQTRGLSLAAIGHNGDHAREAGEAWRLYCTAVTAPQDLLHPKTGASVVRADLFAFPAVLGVSRPQADVSYGCFAPVWWIACASAWLPRHGWQNLQVCLEVEVRSNTKELPSPAQSGRCLDITPAQTPSATDSRPVQARRVSKRGHQQ